MFASTAKATQEFYKQNLNVFPSKNILQLKIREVRQKLMAETGSTGGGLPVSSDDASQDSTSNKESSSENKKETDSEAVSDQIQTTNITSEVQTSE